MKKKYKIVIFLIIFVFVVFAMVYAFFKVRHIYSTTEIIPETPEKIKILSFNINHGEDNSGSYGLKEIIEIIKDQDADIVTLNDVDNMSVRTYREDQARKIAGNLGMNFTYGNINEVEGGWNGNAILSKYPLTFSGNRFYRRTDGKIKQAYLHGIYNLGGLKLHVITTELSEIDTLAEGQNQELLDRMIDAMSKYATNDPMIVTGSLNLGSSHSSIKGIDNYFVNATKKVSNHLTYPAQNPVTQRDYVFFRKNIKSLSVKVINDNNTRNASDHLPILTEFLLR